MNKMDGEYYLIFFSILAQSCYSGDWIQSSIFLYLRVTRAAGNHLIWGESITGSDHSIRHFRHGQLRGFRLPIIEPLKTFVLFLSWWQIHTFSQKYIVRSSLRSGIGVQPRVKSGQPRVHNWRSVSASFRTSQIIRSDPNDKCFRSLGLHQRRTFVQFARSTCISCASYFFKLLFIFRIHFNLWIECTSSTQHISIGVIRIVCHAASARYGQFGAQQTIDSLAAAVLLISY